ncbi:Nucleotide-binding universal stress protein, UspA family [Devosia enhydra]|uniref:Nucleotide-binding universal stress protein, UspA family n=1 Tax=Devosia enhydra TaxID=665118 RepID=A0A1K2HXQ4_9HYPH|nr:universal stress protein [Devosia enhydra]SFZ84538.1 Nucleotide-binding universal stress protein, UspA family [Devosia enhydra]
MKIDLLVPILLYPDIPTPEHVAETVRVGRQLGEAASALIVEAVLPRLEGHWGSKLIGVAGMAKDLETRQHAAAEALRQQLDGQATIEAVRISEGQIQQAISVRARSHDLTLIGTETIESRQLGQTLVFDAGRPVVLVPAQTNAAKISRIAIAWDGSRAAARAVHDAMPWISTSSSLTIITAFDDKTISEQTVADLQAYLARRGLDAFCEDVSANGEGVGLALQDGALRHRADMLVMGAFGHSRLRDFILGGATEAVFAETRLPIFMSH